MTTLQTIPTPLTDAAEFDADNWNQVTSADFARKLERALHVAKGTLTGIQSLTDDGEQHRGSGARISRISSSCQDTLQEIEELLKP